MHSFTHPPALGELDQVERPYLRLVVWTANRLIVGCLAGLAAHAALQLTDNRDPRVSGCNGSSGDCELRRRSSACGDHAHSPRDWKVWRSSALDGSDRSGSSRLYSDRWTPRVRLLGDHSLERCPVLHSRPGCTSALRRVAAPATGSGRPRERLSASRRANISFATALVTTLDARDRYTAGHSAAVAVYARDIAARMGLPRNCNAWSTYVVSSMTSERSACHLACWRSRERSPWMNGARWRSTLRSASGFSPGSRTMPRSQESSGIITSAWMGMATPTEFLERRSHSCRESSPSPTPTTR